VVLRSSSSPARLMLAGSGQAGLTRKPAAGAAPEAGVFAAGACSTDGGGGAALLLAREGCTAVPDSGRDTLIRLAVMARGVPFWLVTERSQRAPAANLPPATLGAGKRRTADLTQMQGDWRLPRA